MPTRPGLDDDEALKNLIALWRDGADDLQSRVDDIWGQIKAELVGGRDEIRLERLTLAAERLERLQSTAEAIADDLFDETSTWIEQGGLHRIYGAGAESTGLAFSFDQPHREALEVLARDLFQDVLRATDAIDGDSKRWVRLVGRKLTGFSLTGGQTPRQAGRRLASELRQDFLRRGMGAVTYADGSRHSFGEYAEMLLRTKTGVIHNTGALRQGERVGIKYWELLDGTNCGLTSHHDPQLANGLIVDWQTAMAYPLAHPNAFMGGQEFLSLGPVREVVRARYRGPSIGIRTAQSDALTVSPEHPVLTARGWVEARHLREGDYLLRYDGWMERGFRSGSYFDERPSGHDGFSTLVECGSHSVRVPTADDLHGAGQFCDPEIDVVDVDGLLRDHVEALGLQGTRYGSLGKVHLASLLDRLGAPDELGARSPTAFRSGVRWQDESAPATVVEFAPSLGHGVASGSGRVAVSPERGTETALIDGEAFARHDLGATSASEIEGVIPGEFVQVDKPWSWHEVTSVQWGEYDGFAYDASTVDEAYLVGGLVVANCRRAVNARPDLNDRNVGSAVSVQPAENLANQVEFEKGLALQSRARAQRRQRARRARQTRPRRPART